MNVSIVLYQTDYSEVKQIVDTLRRSEVVSSIFLVDNSPVENGDFKNLDAIYIFNNANLGYGKAHNIALRKTIFANVEYHLVLNADLIFDSEILAEMLQYMSDNPDVGHMMPKIFYPNGSVQYLCKMLPTPFDLFGRRFLPKSWTKIRNARFEMRATNYDTIMNAPYLSGCFMLLRIEALEEVGLFDERFFMYPEDIDLTRRIHVRYKTVFYPNVQVIHNHAQKSYKGLKMLYIHILNLIRYFNKWGWIFDAERKAINKKIVEQYKL